MWQSEQVRNRDISLCGFRLSHGSIIDDNISEKEDSYCPVEERKKAQYSAYKIQKSTFKCGTCNFFYKTKELLEKHESKIHSETNFSCDTCGETFGEKYRLVRHMNSHRNKKSYGCAICDKRFKRECEVHVHIRAVHEGMEEGNLQDYVKVIDEKCGRQEKCFQCQECGNSFKSHMRTIHNDGKPKCEICGKILSSNYILETHMNMHMGKKPFTCEYCGKSFTAKGTLEMHLRTHTGESPFQCPLCQKSFKQKSSIKQHFKTKHPGKLIIQLQSKTSW